MPIPPVGLPRLSIRILPNLGLVLSFGSAAAATIIVLSGPPSPAILQSPAAIPAQIRQRLQRFGQALKPPGVSPGRRPNAAPTITPPPIAGSPPAVAGLIPNPLPTTTGHIPRPNPHHQNFAKSPDRIKLQPSDQRPRSISTPMINSDEPSELSIPEAEADRSDRPIVALSEIIYLALENNIDVKNAYLDRLVQKSALSAAESKFSPRFTPRFTVNLDPIQDRARLANGALTAQLEAEVSMPLPTGGNIAFAWTGDALSRDDQTRNGVFRQGYRLELTQPLLRGAGSIAALDIQQARLTEQNNLQTLRTTLTDKITEVILAYRQLLQAQQQVIIEGQSLANAQQSLLVTQALIDAGRKAPVDRVQNQADIANRRVTLLTAQNDLESQRISLLRLLDLPQSRPFQAEPLTEISAPILNPDRLLSIASSNPSQIQSQLAVELDRLELRLAQDRRRWDLSLRASLSDKTNQVSDARIALSASRSLGDRSLDQSLKQAEIRLQKSELLAKRSQQNLELDVRDRLRTVNLTYAQLTLSRQATQLAQQQLVIEQQKFRVGRSNNLDVIQLQNALSQARAGELGATIEYLNSLTRLDQTLGTTLETWKLQVDRLGGRPKQ
jgi:outer membrane protein TolC